MIRERVDAFPSHKWLARFVLPLAILQRTTQVVGNELFDTILLVYLWWLSEVTANESWLARREVEK